MYEKVTRSIRVRVRPEYLEAQSAPDEGRFFWSYTVEIANEGSETMQLRSRYWRITDANGRVEEVRGPGVVGSDTDHRPRPVVRVHVGLPAPDGIGHHGGIVPDGTAGRHAGGHRYPAVLARQPVHAAQPQLTPVGLA